MTDDARIGAGTAYRGFLFSDLRGFTAFAERHGNSAAAAKVERFLEIARRAIARHDGAEVKTEGDAIHAVFPSASGAVLCGLDIQDGAAELNAEDPVRPIALGVGVHAGEAVETAAGYIGRAVNIAARLCAAAGPGEVLVSSTVKGITQSSINVGFVPRGKRRLKGIEDPIVVYAVTRDPDARPARAVPRFAVLGVAAGAIVALVALAAVALSPRAGEPAASKVVPTLAPTGPAAQPVAMGPLTIGTYATQQFQPRLTFDVADPGWTANRDVPAMLNLLREGAPRGAVTFARVQEVIVDPCIEGDDGQSGPGVAEVVSQLQVLAHLEVTGVQPAEVGGVQGRQADVVVSEGALAACGGLVGAEVSLFRIGNEVWRASAGERFRVIELSLGGRSSLTILLSLDWTQTHSVQELESLLELGQRVLRTVTFSGPAQS